MVILLWEIQQKTIGSWHMSLEFYVAAFANSAFILNAMTGAERGYFLPVQRRSGTLGRSHILMMEAG